MNGRVLKIIKLLIDSNEFKTVSWIADKVGVSNKTVRNDFKSMEKILEENGLKLIKKPGVGICIEGDEKEKLNMISNVKAYRQVSSQYTSFDRQLYILSQLLTSSKKITTSSLQEELFISRPSVYNDLDKVREWLAERDIELICDNKIGITIQAGEKRIRKAMFDLFFLSKEYDKVIDMDEIGKESHENNYASINYFSYSQKEDILGVDYEKVYNIVLNLEKKFNIKFTTNDLKRLTVKYGLAISRMMDGKFVDMKNTTLEDLEELSKYDNMSEVVKEIEREFNIKVPVEEVGYLFGITIVAKTHFDDEGWNISAKMQAVNKIITKEIIELTKENYYIDNEAVFYNGIFHHLKSVTNKIKYKLEFENNLVDDIRKNYPGSFEIALKSKSIFEEYYNYEIPIEEIGYIALHIAAAVERSKKPLKTWIVYSSSYSEIKLMIEILKNNFNQIVIDKVLPMSMIYEMETEIQEIDLIITTQKIDKELNKKMIVLPTALVYDDIQKLGKVVREIYENQNSKKLKKYHN